MKKIAIIGAGASGIMTALNLKNKDAKIILIEKNKVVGQKLSITGSGRCNITNTDSKEEFFAKIPENSKFFSSAFTKFSNYDLITYLEDKGIKLKYEANRVYPKSESAQKTVNTLVKFLEEQNIEIRLNEELIDFEIKDKKVISITTTKSKEKIDYLVIATGGISYCKNNTFELLKQKSIAISKLYPSLVAIETLDNYSSLSGISVQDVKISSKIDSRIYTTSGNIIFTTKGISGPAIINISSYIVKYQDNYDINKDNSDYIARYKGKNLEIYVDFLSNISEENLRQIIFEPSKKQLKTKLSPYLPDRLLKYLLKKYDDTDINNLKKDEKQKIINTIKNYKITIKKFESIKTAIVTKGGVDLKYMSSSTMKYKDISNLYFVGECLDLDAMTGGYNLQIAFSTGYLAAKSIEKLICV